MSKPFHWTERLVFERLAKVFPPPAFVLLPQVRNGTGFSRRRTRTADAIAASVWPSRGLYLVGVEIKVCVHDWRRELADAAKSESAETEETTHQVLSANSANSANSAASL